MIQYPEVNNGIIPLTIKMLKGAIVQGTQLYYCQFNLTMVSIIGRFISVKRDANHIRYNITITDDSDNLKVSYFSKHTTYDPIQKLTDENLSEFGYQQFILSVKIHNNEPCFVLQHYQQSSLTNWMLQTAKIVQLEISTRPEIDWNELKNQPIEIQIQEFIRHQKKATISQMLKKFNCTLQHLKVILENLKKKSAITECLDRETYKIVN